jgi:hypothetical protein
MSASARTHLVRADAGVRPCGCEWFILGNFITDATVHPSHGRLSSHRPTVRLSVHPLSSV